MMDHRKYWQFLALMGWLFAAVFFLAFTLQGVAGEIDEFIVQNDGLFLSLGVLILVTSLALLTAYVTNKSSFERERLANEAADRRERFSQRMQALIEISKFRQAWINRVRDDMAALQREFFKHGPHGVSDGDFSEMLASLQRLRLSLNASETNTEKFDAEVASITHPGEGIDPEEFTLRLGKINAAGRKILKDEWERLKKDLEEAQSIKDALK